MPQRHGAAQIEAELDEIGHRQEKRALQPDAQGRPGIGADDGAEQLGWICHGHTDAHPEPVGKKGAQLRIMRIRA